MQFPLTDADLLRLVANYPIGDVPPFDAASRAARPDVAPYDWEIIGAEFVQPVVDELMALPGVAGHQEAFSCAWSSYASVHLSPLDGSSRRGERSGSCRSLIDEGVVVYLSYFAPAAVYGAGARVGLYEGRTLRTTLGAALDPRHTYELPEGEPFASLRGAIESVLARHRVSLVPRSELERPLPFDARIDTNVRAPPFRVFDALFRWND